MPDAIPHSRGISPATKRATLTRRVCAVRAVRWGMLLALLLMSFPGLAASLAAPGIPPIQTFSANEGFPINGRFSRFTQTPSGMVFIADRDQVLYFDGERLSDAGLPEGRYLCVAADDRDRVYFGGYNRLGYLSAPDANGGREVVNLVGKLPDWLAEDFSFRRAEATRDGVLFLGRRHVIRLDRDDHVTQVFPLPDGARGFTTLEASHGRLFINASDLGIVEIIDGRMVILPGSEPIARHYSLNEMFHLGGDSLFIVSEDQGLYLYDGRRATRIRGEFSDYCDNQGGMGAVMLPDGDLAVATYYGGVALGNIDGHLHKVIRKDFGLCADNSNGGLFLDREDGLWVSTFEGVNRLELGSGFTLFDKAHGFEGIVFDVEKVGDDLIIGTSISSYVLRPGAGELGLSRFDDLVGIHGAVVRMLPMNNGVYVASNVKMHRVTTNPPRAYEVRQGEQTGAYVAASTPDGQRAFVIQSQNVIVYKTWGRRSMSIVDSLQFDKPSIPVDALSPNPSELWVVRDSGDLSARSITRFNIDAESPGYGTMTDFGPGEGLPDGGNLIPFLLGDALLLATRDGFVAYHADEGRFVPHTQLNKASEGYNQDIRHVQTDEHDRVWYLTGDSQGHVLLPDGQGYTRDPLPAMALQGEVRSFRVLDHGEELWVGLSNGNLLRYDYGGSTGTAPMLRPVLSRIAIPAATFGGETDSVLFGGLHPAGMPRRGLPSKYGSLRFEYALPLVNSFGHTQYRTRLVGFNDGWSPWSREAYRDFTSLFEGTYTFEVQARDRLGRISPATTYSFVVRPPWWRTIFAGVLVAGLMFGFYYLVAWWRDRLARIRHEELEEVIAEKSEQLASAREQEYELNSELQRWTEQARLAVTIARDVSLPLSDIDKLLKGIYYSKALDNDDRLKLIRVKQALDHIEESLHHISRMGGRAEGYPSAETGTPYHDDDTGYLPAGEPGDHYDPDEAMYVEDHEPEVGDYDDVSEDPGDYEPDTQDAPLYADEAAEPDPGAEREWYEPDDDAVQDEGEYPVEPDHADDTWQEDEPPPTDHGGAQGRRFAYTTPPLPSGEPVREDQHDPAPDDTMWTEEPPLPKDAASAQPEDQDFDEEAWEADDAPPPPGGGLRFMPGDELGTEEPEDEGYESGLEPVAQDDPAEPVWREEGPEDSTPQPVWREGVPPEPVGRGTFEDTYQDEDEGDPEAYDAGLAYADDEPGAGDDDAYDSVDDEGYDETAEYEGEGRDEEWDERPPGPYAPHDPSEDVWYTRDDEPVSSAPSPRSEGVPLPPSLKRFRRR